MKRTVVSLIAGLGATIAGVGAWAASAAPPFPWSGLIGTDGDFFQAPIQTGYPIRLELPVAIPVSPIVSASLPVTGGQSPVEPTDLASPAPPETEALASSSKLETHRAPTGLRGSMVAVAFNISEFGQSAALDEDGKIRTSKPVYLAGNRLGAIELAVGQGASVSVDRDDLAALVGDRAPTLTDALSRLTGERVTLDALRTRDVAIRYDPLTDALVIDTKS
jgi:hypothetical protein